MSKLTKAFTPKNTEDNNQQDDNTYTPDYSLSTGIIRNNDLRGQVGGGSSLRKEPAYKKMARLRAERDGKAQ